MGFLAQATQPASEWPQALASITFILVLGAILFFGLVFRR